MTTRILSISLLLTISLIGAGYPIASASARGGTPDNNLSPSAHSGQEPPKSSGNPEPELQFSSPLVEQALEEIDAPTWAKITYLHHLRKFQRSGLSTSVTFEVWVYRSGVLPLIHRYWALRIHAEVKRHLLASRYPSRPTPPARTTPNR